MNEHGCWTLKEETDTHVCDGAICKIISKMQPVIKSVVDIGCGDGAYTKYLLECGMRVSGYDGSPLTTELSNGLCRIKDFSEPIDIGKFDLVLCLEVGEHIPEQYEQVFLDNISNAALKMIILSWAVPGQGGTGHVNCRDNGYIISELGNRGWIPYPGLTKRLRNEATISWFKDTLMSFRWNLSQ